MPVVLLVGLSLLLQVAAAALALRLIRLTGTRTAWLLIAAAIALMAVRRGVTLGQSLAGDVPRPPDPTTELVALVISVLMVMGLAAIGPWFGTIRRADAELDRVSRALRTIGACNEILIRATSEPDLLHDICHTIVEIGGYRLAWVGFAAADPGRQVRPVAQAGYEEGYLDTLEITWADTVRGRGPTGTAIRTGEPQMARHILTDPHFEPWRAEALKRGYASSLALPLAVEGHVIGALNVYAAEPDAFGEVEERLLRELADDLAYAVEILRLRARGLRTEKALRAAEAQHRRSEAEYRDLVEHAPLGIYRSTVDGRFLSANPALVEMLGYDSAEDLLALDMARDLYADPDERQALIEKYRAQETVQGVDDVRWKRRDGTVLTVRLSGRLVRDANGAIRWFEMIVEDVTERRKLEAQLRQAQKMEEIGQLSAGIAHDLNNLLSVILLNAQIAVSALDAGVVVDRSDLENVEAAAKKAAAMTERLLGFSRRADLAPMPTDLATVVAGL